MNPTFLLGGELEVRRLGFGAMRIVDDAAEGVRVLRRAVELGVNLIDTADIYGTGRSEEIIADALHPYPEGLVIASKGGLGGGFQSRHRDARPERLKQACDESLRRLKLDRIDLYQLHRHDPEVPIEESVGALDELRKAGKIRLIGLSNISVDQLRRAQTVTQIVSVQNEYNRGLLTSEPVLEACEADGIAFIPWRPLGEGLRDSVDELRWLLGRSPVIVAIPGTSKVEHLEKNMQAGSDSRAVWCLTQPRAFVRTAGSETARRAESDPTGGGPIEGPPPLIANARLPASADPPPQQARSSCRTS